MDVEDGENITRENFWSMVYSLDWYDSGVPTLLRVIGALPRGSVVWLTLQMNLEGRVGSVFDLRQFTQ